MRERRRSKYPPFHCWQECDDAVSCKGADMDKAGIREVAKAAGVSISTVSRAFTRPELVSERTRRKVLDVADRLDFNISRSATSLK